MDLAVNNLKNRRVAAPPIVASDLLYRCAYVRSLLAIRESFSVSDYRRTSRNDELSFVLLHVCQRRSRKDKRNVRKPGRLAHCSRRLMTDTVTPLFVLAALSRPHELTVRACASR